MNGFVSNQLIVFAWAILFGGLLGLSYDVLRIGRLMVHHKRAIISLEDFLFWMVAGLFVFLYITKTNYGTMRGFIFIGLFLGGTVYFLILSPRVISGGTKVLKFLINFAKMLGKIVLTPLKILFKPFTFFLEKSMKGLKKSRKWLIIGIKRFLKDIYYILKKV